jgi:cytochrome c oxidase accessory protein FixG
MSADTENTKHQNTGASRDDVEAALYKKREKIYPRQVHGIFALLRNLAMVGLLGIFYGLPWIDWGGRQAVLFDLPARKFYIFGLTLWPQDFIYLSLLLILAALSLFFFTALAGRLWCGYACPQTVWTEIFMWIERKVEGDRKDQIKLDKAPLSAKKLARKGSKHLIWMAFALWTGFTFVGWFTPIKTLYGELATFSLGPWETFWILFYGLATWGNAGFLREQVCIYMCPYARFQSAMFDKDTLLIAYDEKRGEPRGSRKRGVDHRTEGLGDCINCQICVQVCPTGIDIRDGLQYQCIGCAACVDACDDVMDKMGYPKGLVRYTTENALEGKKTHLLRPRVIIYASLLTVLLGALITALAVRVPLELDILRDRSTLYQETSEGLVENVYTLKIINMTDREQTYQLSVKGIDGAQLINRQGEVSVDPGAVLDLPVRVRADPVNLEAASSDIVFVVESQTTKGLRLEETGRFLGPAL